MGGLASTRRFSLASALLSLIVIVLSFSSHAAFPCVFDEAVETEGHRRLALIVGVGQYASEGIPDLEGPSNDARRVRDLLVREPHRGGYGFPRENVCLLLDDQATTDAFLGAFEAGLIARVRTGRDVVVFFHAGHGSRMPDCNGDESDGWDETLMFHDARSGPIMDFPDDELNALLARLHEKTRNVTVILDACHSGTATRGGTFVARGQPADRSFACPTPSQSPGGKGDDWGDGTEGWTPKAFPGLVAFTASADDTSAFERRDESGVSSGVFTDALITALGQVGERPLTYAQLARRIPLGIAARVDQIPYFQGDLDKPVFGNTGRTRPLGWDVIALDWQDDTRRGRDLRGASVHLGGPPLPGLGPGAELRVYDGAVTGADTDDPGKAKAVVVMEDFSGIDARARIDVDTIRPGAAPAVGDLAVLARVANRDLEITVCFRPEHEPGGVPEKVARLVGARIEEDPEVRHLVRLIPWGCAFEISRARDGRLVLRGPENSVRKAFDDYAEIPKNLRGHARQRALRQLVGEGGGDFVDNRTLQIGLVPARNRNPAFRGWFPSPPRPDAAGIPERILPLGYSFHVSVTLEVDAPAPLLVGGLVLSTDGSLHGFPRDGRAVLLHPGKEFTFRESPFEAQPPLDVRDTIMVFGTWERNPVRWHLLADTAGARTRAGRGGTLNRILHRYFAADTRGGGLNGRVYDPTTWTLSVLDVRVRDLRDQGDGIFRDTPDIERPLTPRTGRGN